MQLFTYSKTRPFKRGALGESYIPLTLLPLNGIRGSGSPVFRQLSAFTAQQVQMQAVPNAWHGSIAGAFTLQPLVNENGQAVGPYSDNVNAI